jgi:bacterioferritin
MNAKRKELVGELNRLMAEELEGFLRYFQMRFRLKGIDRLAADKFFTHAIEETQEHAEEIAKQIRSLGETPQLKIHLNTNVGPANLTEALQEMLTVEQQALDAYKEMLPHVTGDPVLEDFIRKQVATETEHIQEIKTLLE